MTETLRSKYDGLLADLDGVVYVGSQAVPGAVEALNGARRAGLGVAYVTNNANRPAGDVVGHLRDLGIELDETDVVTSAQIAAALLREQLSPGAKVLAVGGPGVSLALRSEGLEPVLSVDDCPVAVMQGYGPDVGWRQLAEAAYAIQAGARWMATNTDLTIPQARGIAPGNGTLVNAVRQAVAIDPQIAGKPQAVSFTASAERIGVRHPLVLGDRLDTDIEGANAAGYDSLMVLTGVHGYQELVAAPAEQRPTYIAYDLAALDQAAPEVTVTVGSARSGAVEVVKEGALLSLTSGTDPVDVVRAAVALAWQAADVGEQVTPDQHVAELIAKAR